MKTPFTVFQAVISALCAAAFLLCIGSDIFLLTVGNGSISPRPVVTNLLLSIASLAVSAVLILRTSKVDTFGEEVSEEEDRLPAVSALRTYFCMLAFDLAGVMCLMLDGIITFHSTGKSIMIFAPLMFAAAAVTYFIRVSRIGLVDFSDAEEKTEETAAEPAEEQSEAAL